MMLRRFIALYFFYLGILFSLVSLPSSPLYFVLNTGQTELILYFLDFFLQENQRIGIDIWINSHYKIVITPACNGLIPLVFLYASILAYPCRFWNKVICLLLGYIILLWVNIFRIYMVVWITQNTRGQEAFFFAHDILGNLILMLTGLILFVSFIKAKVASKACHFKIPID
jgi:exosortase/archaeosortase family protein